MLDSNVVRFLKSPQSSDTVIKIYDDQQNLIGCLSLIKGSSLENDYIVESLTSWRNKYMKFFLSQFTATTERTRDWLKNTVIASDNRLLFLIYDNDENLIGNFGVANISRSVCELDNLIRGNKGGHSRLIFYSEVALLHWIFNENNVKNVNLHVFSNNHLTLRLHREVGFQVCSHRKIYKSKKNDKETYYHFDEAGELLPFEYIEMEITADILKSSHPSLMQKSYD